MKQLLTLLFLSMFSFAVIASEDDHDDHYDDHGDHAHHPGDIIVEVEGGEIEVDTGVSILYKATLQNFSNQNSVRVLILLRLMNLASSLKKITVN